jgi:pyridinium-3,5-biscarboxylic acid mononucleotide synthase
MSIDLHSRPDLDREDRQGVPEIIFAQSKTIEQAVHIAQRFLVARGRAILSRVSPELHQELQCVATGDVSLEWHPHARMAVLRRSGASRLSTGGRVGVVSAGTSDIPMAEEAGVVCQEMGCVVHTVFDVGVAGLHRLFGPLEHLTKELDVDAIIVVAGMDGALPSVVAGLVAVPVVGLPTSVGYGLGGQGIGALYAMLQSCAPGLAVVNIDNGVGAGTMAAKIANRAAQSRGRV